MLRLVPTRNGLPDPSRETFVSLLDAMPVQAGRAPTSNFLFGLIFDQEITIVLVHSNEKFRNRSQDNQNYGLHQQIALWVFILCEIWKL